MKCMMMVFNSLVVIINSLILQYVREVFGTTKFRFLLG